MENNEYYDIAIASDDQYDLDFVKVFETEANKYNLKIYFVGPYNLEETIIKLQDKSLKFGFFIDRASNTSKEFIRLHNYLHNNKVLILDALDNIMRSSDKSTMHLEFISNGIITPYTIILPPIKDSEDLHHLKSNISKIGKPFIIKPATNTGGGKGVVNGGQTLEDILKSRKEYHVDKYLIQEKVTPQEKDGKRFWFRGFYACNYIECCWWNDLTKIYSILTNEEIEKYNLFKIVDLIKKIAVISKLKFFSTEIALNNRDEFVVVDYVNETCDMRLKSKCFDGVPDETVVNIAKKIVSCIKEEISRN